MTDDDYQQQIDELRETVVSLQERVSELESGVDSSGGETTDSSPYDHYDRDAMKILDDDPADAHPRDVMQAYEMVGIVDEGTKKKRAKRLKRLAEGA